MTPDIEPDELARLLRNAGREDAATAAEASAMGVRLAYGQRDDLLTIYRVRRHLQLDAGRRSVAAEIAELLRALEEHPGERVSSCLISGDEHHYACWLDRHAESVLGVIVPPRRVSGEADARQDRPSPFA